MEKIVKEKQRNTRDETIPPPETQDGTASRPEEKADSLEGHFSNKINVPCHELKPPTLPLICDEKLCNATTSIQEMLRLLCNVDIKKATGPDGLLPQFPILF